MTSAAPARVGLVVLWFTQVKADEAGFEPANGFPADATLKSQGGRGSEPLYPGFSKRVTASLMLLSLVMNSASNG